MPSKFVKKETLESLISLWYLKSLKSILLVVIQLTFQFRRWKDKTVLDCTETIRNHGDSLDMWHHLCLVILWVWCPTHICHQTLSGYHQFTDGKDNWSKQWYFNDKYFAGYFNFHCFGWFQPILHQDQGENQIELHQEHIIKYKEIQWYLKESPLLCRCLFLQR